MLLAHKFLALGYNHRSLQDGYECWPDKSVFVGHVVKPVRLKDALYLCERLPCVIPLRHPYLTAESWARRGKELDGLIVSWLNLKSLMEFEPYLVPVDHPDRDKYLDRVIEGLKIPLSKQWPVVNSKQGTQDLSWTDITPPDAIRYLVDELPFLEPIYGHCDAPLQQNV